MTATGEATDYASLRRDLATDVEKGWCALLALDITKVFVDEWAKDPMRWLQEIDVQVELAGRMGAAFRLMGKDTVLARHSDYPIADVADPFELSRVTCEPYVKLRRGDGEESYAHPDLVVWDDGESGSPVNDGYFSSVWVCEIKYKSSIAELDASEDPERMSSLVSNDWGRYACCLELLGLDLKEARVVNQMTWRSTGRGGLLVWRVSPWIG